MYSTVPHESSEACLAAEDEETADEVSSDEVAIIFGFLSHVDIMRDRRVCTTWRDAAKKTIVPSTEFVVNSVRSYNAMRVMSTALPNLHRLHFMISAPGINTATGRIQMKGGLQTGFTPPSRFRIWDNDNSSLNGRYPVFFSFPLLKNLAIYNCGHLKWDLEMLEGLPSLKEIDCSDNPHLTGNIRSLRILIDTLEKVDFDQCPKIRGDLMDLADFPRLKVLHLRRTKVTGDIRDIRRHDFPALESLDLPYTVHGGVYHTFQLMSDVPSFMHAIHLLFQRNPKLFKEDLLSEAFGWDLSEASPDWYDWEERYDWESETPTPPFRLQLIQADARRGWCWCSDDGHSCEINWLDLEPSSQSRGCSVLAVA
eukprot:scaffold12330_cov83-Skeletonema_marinoi.AAC.8